MRASIDPTAAAPSRVGSNPPSVASVGLGDHQTKVLGAFLLIYVVWGSNFLAIRYAIETIPPFLLMGVRSLLAGFCLYLWARFRSDERPTLAHWRAAAIVGVMLFLGCHGLLAWAQGRVPSGVAALGMATLPLWMTLLDWLWAGAPRPGVPVWLGLGLGLLGLSVLVGPGSWGGAVDLTGLLALQASGFAWALGSVKARRSRLPTSVVLSTGMQLVAGGAALTLVSVLSGEAMGFDPGTVSMRSLMGFAYMVVGASILAFTAYVWLLRVSTPSRVASYAFVNPLVAVVLGSSVGGEPLTGRTALAAVLILAAVAAILSGRRR
jgi:drug/metabolite transporter (DMT)-like permease